MTWMLITRAELDRIGWHVPRPLSKRAISDGPRATITVQYARFSMYVWQLCSI